MDYPVVLLTEEIHASGRALLERDAEVRLAPALDEDSLCDAAADVDAIVLRARGHVTARIMDAAPRLRVIGRHGVGVDNVDVGAATERGIQVLNTPGANVISVAEHVLAGMLTLARHLFSADRAVRTGDWGQRDRELGWELTGGTLGVIGMGAIGQEIARMCRVAFGMVVVYVDPVPRPEIETALGARRVGLDDLLRMADVVTLHVPLVPATRGLIGQRQLMKMKRTAFLINTARGGVVDEHALAAALHANHLAGALVDVFECEPPGARHPLLGCERVILTPHSAAMTDQASRRMALVVEDILSVLAGHPPRHPVNYVGRDT
jgi:D-3-phosphoglycerate dehydrogenase